MCHAILNSVYDANGSYIPLVVLQLHSLITMVGTSMIKMKDLLGLWWNIYICINIFTDFIVPKM